MTRGILFAALCIFGHGLAASLPKDKPLAARQLAVRQAPTATESAATSQSTACGEIIDFVNDGSYLFSASYAFSCLTSVPFNPAVATRFVKYFNETIQFHSSLAYLKNPPQGYQQPAFDVFAALDKIQKRIDEGFYTNEYAFEADFQLLTYSMHDAHVVLNAGILAAFSYGSPWSISSASVDGREPPKVYLTDHIKAGQEQGWQPSAIKSINGEDVVEYLTKYASLNSVGTLEPHADWNALMAHPALEIQGLFTIFDGAGTFYPGDDLTFTLENGTTVESFWVAIYNEPANATGPLSTGGDMYNYFVLGLLPDSYVEPETTEDDGFVDSDGDGIFEFNEQPAQTSWYNDSSHAYPEHADIFQDDLSVAGSGVVTGYFFEDISTGVLSVPSFDILSATIGDFTDAVQYFIDNATAQGISKVVIDLQQNTGGAILLAYITFKQFFPDLDPYAGSRRRIFPMANILGNATTSYYESLADSDPDDFEIKEAIAAEEWIITNRLNAATGKNFSSWQEYQNGPTDNGDRFSLTERYDLANEVFDADAFDQWLPTAYLQDAEVDQRPWAPGQIALLTDGLCSSTCSLFVEMMTRAGVRTVVAGGRPSAGPMQAAAGNRGALAYSADDLDVDIDFARARDDGAEAALPEVRESGMFFNYLGFNLLDQVRPGENVPLQVKYEAADCRIYYTLANIYNTTRLWRDAAAAIFEDSSRCVDGSTGFSTANSTSPKVPPKLNAESPVLSLPVVEQAEFENEPTGGLEDVKRTAVRQSSFVGCSATNHCTVAGFKCTKITVKCPGSTADFPTAACLPLCNNRDGGDGCPGANSFCGGLQKIESKDAGLQGKSASFAIKSGRCVPRIGNKSMGCKRNPTVSPA
ncbi:hypothetical protein GQ43DRAFT_437763 [Delitschia confertaspora ATCC 74209]|uniref:CPAF-like PDZ domain-containing protein n=1 Tax=Delitschia confertaspora ATCC 74209 TaxID=1513339 RepID=A0A9P4MSW4_9PLEO|nr:hypothetical protein GQ43DRAFT_437763 [Delitschia confertaspora ATCC 74209]